MQHATAIRQSQEAGRAPGLAGGDVYIPFEAAGGGMQEGSTEEAAKEWIPTGKPLPHQTEDAVDGRWQADWPEGCE